MSLSPDGQILCFDGIIMKDIYLSLAKKLNEGGIFVVRSSGGNAATAIAISDLVRERRGTVVVRDYCLSTCAAFFVIASYRTFVVKGALVAWSYTGSDDPYRSSCFSLRRPPDKGPTRWQSEPCEEYSPELRAELAAQHRFFKSRVVSPLFEAPPDSLYVRKVIKNRVADTGEYNDIAWTIHPRYYPILFKTKIVFEAYPESQKEVDDIASGLNLKFKVIYDP